MEYHSVMRCTCIHVTVILLPLYAVMRLLKTFGKHFPSCQRALFSIAVWEHTVMPPRLQTTKFFRKLKVLEQSGRTELIWEHPQAWKNWNLTLWWSRTCLYLHYQLIHPHPGCLEHVTFSPKYIIFLITSSRFTLPDWVLLSFNCLGTLRRQVQPHNPAPRLIPAPHAHAYQAAKFYCRPASGHAGQAGK